jgi:hypothetical protein
MTYCERSIDAGEGDVRDELAGTVDGSSPSPPLLADELSDDVLDVVVGGLSTDAALARAAAYGHLPA